MVAAAPSHNDCPKEKNQQTIAEKEVLIKISLILYCFLNVNGELLHLMVGASNYDVYVPIVLLTSHLTNIISYKLNYGAAKADYYSHHRQRI